MLKACKACCALESQLIWPTTPPVLLLRSCSPLQAALRAVRKARTLVFAGNVASANQVAQGLQAAGFPVLLYHRDVPVHVREDVLLQMADR